MSERGTKDEAVGDDTAERFRRIYANLNAIAVEVAEIRRTQIMIMSGVELGALTDIDDDERRLDHELHRLEKLLQAHAE